MPAGRGMGMMGGEAGNRPQCVVKANRYISQLLRPLCVAVQSHSERRVHRQASHVSPKPASDKANLCQLTFVTCSSRQLPYGAAWLRTTRLPTTSAGLCSIEGQPLAWDTKFCNASCMSSGFGSLCCTIESNGQMRMPGLAVLLRLTCS